MAGAPTLTARRAVDRGPSRQAWVPALALVLALAPATASAHERSPEQVTLIDAVEPSLPPGVVVQVQPSVADQLVAENRTDRPLEVLDREGRPFLRIRQGGVEADLARADWYTSNDPSGAAPVPAPVRADPAAPARWVRVSDTSSWGWFDHRLHERTTRGDQAPLPWAVPLRYGGQDLLVRGRVVHRPVLGGFVVTADPAPSGLTVAPLQGRLPGLFVRLTGAGPVTVLGADGEPFARLDGTGATVWPGSPTFRDDRRARGMPLPDPVEAPQRVSAEPALSWLDGRLQYPAAEPPPEAARRAVPTRLVRWRVPVETPEGPAAITGDVAWVPAAASAQEAASGDRGRPWLVVAAAGVVLAAAAGLRTARRRRPQGGAH